jgi:hypothetical protein
LFVTPDAAVQATYSGIANYIQAHRDYSGGQVARFLAGADGWVIAHAQADGGTVVTLETFVLGRTTRVKIPNVCRQFGVPCMNPYEMLRALGVSFTLASRLSVDVNSAEQLSQPWLDESQGGGSN